MTDRAAYLSSLIGRPWSKDGNGPDTYHCWALASEVERRLFGRLLPHITLPDTLTLQWMRHTLKAHPEAARWCEVPTIGGIIQAGDGALVSMACADRAFHVGVYLQAEREIIHADDRFGVLMEPPARLRARGWGRLRYHEPVPS